MRFRPCIDIHNGIVKQIVGSSLKDENDQASENYVANRDASWFAKRYKQDGLQGGHVILLNPQSSPYYEKTKKQALEALHAYEGGLQAGGGITPDNALDFLRAGASHVIVTSYVFNDGCIQYDRLKKLTQLVGKQRLVLDVSCRKIDEGYCIMTDRWQKFTKEVVTLPLLEELSAYCDEFLVHAVDVEGKNGGIEAGLVRMLSDYDGIPVTYAGGVHSWDDIELLKKLGKGKIDMTIGSALDLFGGTLSYERLAAMHF